MTSTCTVSPALLLAAADSIARAAAELRESETLPTDREAWPNQEARDTYEIESALARRLREVAMGTPTTASSVDLVAAWEASKGYSLERRLRAIWDLGVAAAEPQSVSGADELPAYVIYTRPGMVPERKGPYPTDALIESALRELHAAHPDATSMVIRLPSDCYPQSGVEWIDMYGDESKGRLRPSGNAGELPPLPEPVGQIGEYPDEMGDAYDAGQMIDYARAALAAQAQPPVSQPVDVDERVKFEAWQVSTGFKRPDDPGEWEAWQARAALAQQSSEQPPAAYILASDLQRLSETPRRGCSASMTKAPRQGFVPVFLAPQITVHRPSDIEAMVRMLESGEWAEHAGQSPMGRRLERVITELIGTSRQHAEYDDALDSSYLSGLADGREQASRQERPLIARALSDWHEDDGPVAWWAWCGHEWAGEPAWVGTPLDSDWPGHHTHWTAHPPLPVSAAEVVAATDRARELFEPHPPKVPAPQ